MSGDYRCPECTRMNDDDLTLERYSIVCPECQSSTWFDNDEELPMSTLCWRCGEIINGEL